MKRYNLWMSAAIIFGGGSVIVAGVPPTPSDPKPPAIDRGDRRFLSRVARRTCEQYWLDGSIYEIPYVPASISDLRCDVVVTLRRYRLPIGSGSAGPDLITSCVIQATIAALQVADAKLKHLTDTTDLLIEIEAVGREVPLPYEDSQPGFAALAAAVEQGVDGCTFRNGDFAKRVCPSEFATKNLTIADAFKSLADTVGGVRQGLSLARFRTRHWYQRSATATDIVDLRRGMTLVKPNRVTPQAIDDALSQMIHQLERRRRPDGRFAYEYEPSVSNYSRMNDPVHQAGAAWTFAMVATTDEGREAAGRAIDVHRETIRDLPGIDGAACVTSDDDRNKLGLTAQILLAMYADPERYTHDRERLTNGILWLQQPSGKFITAFPPARRLTGARVHAGLALLALVEQYDRDPTARTLRAFSNALSFYSTDFEQNPTLAAAAWLARPFAKMAVVSNRKDFQRFSARLADWIIDHQITEANNAWPELNGGFRTAASPIPGIGSAVALSALVDAARAAKRFGDTERAARYRSAADDAARFTLQLQVRPSEAYATRYPEKTVGAVRTSVADNRLRIDGLQHAIQALTEYRLLLQARND